MLTAGQLIVGRAVAGMGASGLQNGAMTIIAGCVPMHKRPNLLVNCSQIIVLALLLIVLTFHREL